MSGYFAVASKNDCVLDLFFGVDYHTHLGTKRGGMCVYGETGFQRAIHNIENSPFRTKFEKDANEFKGYMGIGCISDYESQPLLMRSHLGTYAITTVGAINNIDELTEISYSNGVSHFFEMTNGDINPTELVASLIYSKRTFEEGIQYVQDVVKGSMSIMILTKSGIYCARDKVGRTPIIIGKKEDGYCASFESSAFVNLGYTYVRDLGPAEIIFMTHDQIDVRVKPQEKMKVCSFLWVYYGYPTSTYEGINVEVMRNRSGELLAKRDSVEVDCVAGIPDSGTPHAIGYSNVTKIPFARPFIKYTPTWPRSFMPSSPAQRKMTAKMKLIPVTEMIENKRLLLIDDSIVRGTQLGDTAEFLYETGAKEVHVRPGCPPIVFGCKYLNFSRSKSEMDLMTRRVIAELEGEDTFVTKEVLRPYTDPDHEKYQKMCDKICEKCKFTTLQYQRLDDMIKAIGLDKSQLCTYCFDGEE